MKQYYIGRNGETLGKFTADQINEGLKNGQFRLDDFIFNKESNEWIALKEANFQPVHSSLDNVSNSANKKKYYKYEDVPWFRKSGTNSLFIIFSFLCAPLFLITIVSVLTGEIYYKNKRNKDGSLKHWSSANKVAAIILIVLYCFAIGSTIFSAVKRSAASGAQSSDASAFSANQTSRSSKHEAPVNLPPSSKSVEPSQKSAVLISQKLPTSLEKGAPYILNGMLLLQNGDGFWLVDLVPDALVKQFPNPPREGQESYSFQIVLNDLVRFKQYAPGLQKAILIPKNESVYDQINVQEQQIIRSARGKFHKYESVELTSGAASRLPVFIVDSITLWDGKTIWLNE